MNPAIPPAVAALIGRPTTRTYLVTARDIKRFAQAIGERNPVHYDEQFARNTAHGGIVAPPLFCQSLTYEDVPPEELGADGSPREINLPIDATRTVGGGSQYTVHRLVRAGEWITVTSELRDVRTKQGRSGVLYLIDVETRFSDAGGQPVATELATYIKRT